MNVYFLRHGETELNKEKVHQPAHTELSREGLKQAENAGKFLKDLGIEVIYSSSLTRAFQTTEVVRKKINVPVIMNDDLKEIRRPSTIVGQKHDINEVIEVKRKIRYYYPIEHWHHSDEENFFDLKKRANSFKQLLENTLIPTNEERVGPKSSSQECWITVSLLKPNLQVQHIMFQ